MRTFRIAKELSGWCVVIGAAMVAPCKSQAAAVAQAERMAEAIRRHGVPVEIVLEETDLEEEAPPEPLKKAAARRKAVDETAGRSLARA